MPISQRFTLSSLRANSPQRLASHPALAFRSLNERLVREVAGVQRIADLTARNVRIIGAAELLDARSVPTALRELLENGCLALFIEADVEQLAELGMHFGRWLHRVDSSAETTGLYMLNVDRIIHTPLGQTPAVRRALAGMSTAKMRSAAIKEIGSEIELNRAGWLSRTIHSPHFLVYILVFVYSSLRALPVVFIKQFHGSLVVLWSIDIITAVPYTWGVLAMLFAKRWQVRLAGTLTTLVTFVSPYVYFWLHGRNYPPYVALIILGLTLLSILLELGKFNEERRLRARYAKAAATACAAAAA